MDRTVALLRNEVSSDFIDLNCGCPIDLVCNRGCGASLMNKPNRLLDIVKSMTTHSGRSVTVKIRTGNMFYCFV
jgi:tRNA-dihydrouridine synthase 3